MGSTSSGYRFPRGHTPHLWKLGTWAEATVPKLEDVASRYGRLHRLRETRGVPIRVHQRSH
jgi:hypothetical protein